MNVKTRDTTVGRRLAANLDRLIGEQGSTPYRLAKASGISFRTIYRLLDAGSQSDPAISMLEKIAEALDCEIADLLVKD